MFEQQKKKTELMIVCDDKTMQYANYLIQLIGQNDDNGESAVGIKDGTVSAAIYTEKQYKDTLARITSNTHILFMGNNKSTKEQAKFLDCQIDCFGMKYGWLGKRAVMFVDESVKKDEYNDFVDYAKKFQLEYKKKDEKKKAKPGIGAVAGAAGAVGAAKVALPAVAVGVGAWLLTPIVEVAGIYGIVKSSKAKKDVKEQQYRCLTLAVYMDGLQKFLEE